MIRASPQVSSAIKHVFPPEGAGGNAAVAHFPPDDSSDLLSEWNRFEIFLCWMHLLSDGWWSFVYLSPTLHRWGIHFHVPSFASTCNVTRQFASTKVSQ